MYLPIGDYWVTPPSDSDDLPMAALPMHAADAMAPDTDGYY
jgi:hypothetical protein